MKPILAMAEGKGTPLASQASSQKILFDIDSDGLPEMVTAFSDSEEPFKGPEQIKRRGVNLKDLRAMKPKDEDKKKKGKEDLRMERKKREERVKKRDEFEKDLKKIKEKELEQKKIKNTNFRANRNCVTISRINMEANIAPIHNVFS